MGYTLDVNLIKRIEFAVLNENREVFVILTNGIPWTSVIIPILILSTAI